MSIWLGPHTFVTTFIVLILLISYVDFHDKSSSLLSTISVAPPAGIRQKEGLDVWHSRPGERYFRHDRDSWPNLQGQPFEVFEECLEDQLAAEAKMLSPLNYEHDDKENTINELAPLMPTHFHGSVTIVPSSRYRPTREDHQVSETLALVNHALYDTRREFPEPYGLEGSDGTQEERLCGLSVPHSSTQAMQIHAQDSVRIASHSGTTMCLDATPESP